MLGRKGKNQYGTYGGKGFDTYGTSGRGIFRQWASMMLGRPHKGEISISDGEEGKKRGKVLHSIYNKNKGQSGFCVANEGSGEAGNWHCPAHWKKRG